MASSSSSPLQPPSSDPLDPPLGVPLLLPAPPPPSSRRLPPPCWTPDETSALIDAYRDKWYSLRRGNLRAAHWQDVADHVHRECPLVSPPKTAVQCRHKMEKLRKRYRAELQRAKSIPHHRFSSSWVYFSKMDSMEKGQGNSNNSAPTMTNNNYNYHNPLSVADDFVNDALDLDDDDDNNPNLNSNDAEDYHTASPFPKDFHRNGLRIRIAANSRKNFGGFQQTPNPNPNPNPNSNPNFGFKSSMSRCSEYGTPPQLEEGRRYAARVVRNGNNGGAATAGGSSSRMGEMGLGMEMNMMKKKRSSLGKREREKDKGDKVATEMVEAIRVLGDGFLRMEMMKMEMMRENERIRIENEMKRTQMFLQSQQNLVQGFLKGWTDLIINNNHNHHDDDDDTKDAS
ncbi:Trihelix transcription factor ASIL2 [Bienertia sinuspersici]